MTDSPSKEPPSTADDTAAPQVPEKTDDCVQSRSVTGARWVLLVFSILSSTFIFALDNTILANVLPAIVKDLRQLEKLTWMLVGYGLGQSCFNPIWGKLYERFNNKLLYSASVIIFDAGSALCGAAPSENALIVGRVIAGVGGAGTYVGTYSIFAALTPIKERPLYASFVGAVWCIGTVLGPIIGGAFANSSATWRWGFYLNLCVSAVAAPFFLLLLPSNPSRINQKGIQRLTTIDFIGAVLFTGAFLTLTMAISFGGSIYAWNSGSSIVLFVVSILLWIILALQQAFSLLTSTENRLLPVHLATRLEMAILAAETACGLTCTILPTFFLPLFFQFVDSASALSSGVRLLPYVFATVVGLLLNGALFKKFSRSLPWYLAGSALATLGAGLMTTITPTVPNARVYGFSVILGFGAGLFLQAGYAVGQARSPPADQSQVTAFLALVQTAGAALAIAVGTSLFINIATEGIAEVLPGLPLSMIQEAVSGAGSSLLQGLSTKEQTAVLAVIAAAVRDVFIVVAATGGLALVLSLFLKKDRAFPLNR